jgi:hypothetical protein
MGLDPLSTEATRKPIEQRQPDLVTTSTGRLAARLYPLAPNFVDSQIVRVSRRFYS